MERESSPITLIVGDEVLAARKTINWHTEIIFANDCNRL